MNIRKMKQMDHQKVIRIMQQLPDWFNEKARRNIKIDLEFHKGFVAEDTAGETTGFLTFYVYEAVGVIGWFGVLSDKHRTGIGTDLLTAFEDEMKKNGINLIQVIEYRRVPTNDPDCPEELYLRKELEIEAG